QTQPAINNSDKAADFTAPGFGTLTGGPGKPSADTESWCQFRGINRDGIASTPSVTGLYRAWPASGPKVLWTIAGLSEGYSGAAIFGGKVYFHDYDSKAKRWMIRCVSLADGAEIWRWSYARVIRRNHGMTRTVPATDGKYVISLDPKCVLHCFDADKGTRLWAKNLPGEYGTRIPAWYNGQCPLIEQDRVIIGIGGDKVLMAAIDKATGKPIWETPNTGRYKMSHASVVPMTIDGRKQYVWCTLKGVVGVDADDGKVLWELPRRANVALAPSAVEVGDGRIFVTSGYKAGSAMLQVSSAGKGDGKTFSARILYGLSFEQFNSECHSPVLWAGHLFAVDHAYATRQADAGGQTSGRFTCLKLDGKIAWQHEGATFGLGNWLFADGLIFLMDGDSGMLRLIEASTERYKELAGAQVLSGHDVWTPMAYANGKLVLRDLSKMVCIQVGYPLAK
ncbi:MAG: PQQ-like beta-propeller repeat protein, partial [Planctomycetes bacterium]|nr:PQQ-like beta-propeller repeat protein [Planctomycetota bacterium]